MALSGSLYPAPGFSFSVTVSGTGASAQQGSRADASFQEVSGLDPRIETETVAEGGENRYVHQLPGATRTGNLVLRRGYITAASFLSEWAAQTVGSTLAAPILTQTLIVQLLGQDHQPLVAWNFARAWPVRWATGPFDSMRNEVLTEVLEFSYATVTRMPLTGDASSMAGTVAKLIGG
ncbi:phage tail protein [Azospirillum sp. 412522]|nr:phage tail protein [Azospirillum sp. 412522]MBY6263638.1 phage tail protein [Azospirillum sp. 412522]